MFLLLAQASEVGIIAAVVAIVTALVSGGIGALTKRAISASEGRVGDKIDRLDKDVAELKGDLKGMKQDTERHHSGLHNSINKLEVQQAKFEARLDETRHGKSKGQ